MANYATEFWSNADEELQELAKQFEQGIDVVYPDRVTSRRMCPCLDYCHTCGHPLEGKAEYYEYNGPRLR